jgi:hypothetical protein
LRDCELLDQQYHDHFVSHMTRLVLPTGTKEAHVPYI